MKQHKTQFKQWYLNENPEPKIIKVPEKKKTKLQFDPKYPWATQGVNKDNKQQWLAMIYKKNPWLRDFESDFCLFEESLEHQHIRAIRKNG